MKNLIKKITCLALLFVAKQTLACGPDYSYNNFTYLINRTDAYDRFSPFKFDPNSRFYGNWQNSNYDKTFGNDAENVQEWQAFLDHKFDDSTVYKFIYKNTLDNINKIATLQSGTTPIEKYVVNNKPKEVLQYLQLTYLYLSPSIRDSNSNRWDYTIYTKIKDKELSNNISANAEKLLQESTTDFIKWRSFYLLLRSNHFQNKYNEANSTFDKYNSKMPATTSIVKYWCWGIKGGALFGLNRKEEAAYWFAQTFINSPDKNTDAITDFRFCNQDYKNVLKYCKTPSEKNAVILAQAVNTAEYNTEFLEELKKNDANSDALALVWFREVDKIEQIFLAQNTNSNFYNPFFSMEEKDFQAKFGTDNGKKHLAKLIEIGTTIANDENNKNQSLIANTLAYIAMFGHQYDIAKVYLDIANKHSKTSFEKNQSALLQNVYNIQVANQINLNDIGKNMLAISDTSQKEKYSSNAAYYFNTTSLIPALYKSKDSTRAIACLLATENITNYNYNDNLRLNYGREESGLVLDQISIAQLRALQNYFFGTSNATTEMDKWIKKNIAFEYNSNFFDCLIAKKYARLENWKEALATLQKCPAVFDEASNPNPYIFRTKDIIELDNIDSSKGFMPMSAIFKLGADLKEKIDGNYASALDNFNYGMLLYDLSYYGKNHAILSHHFNYYMTEIPYDKKVDSCYADQIYFEPMQAKYKLSTDLVEYFRLNNAEKYFLKARSKFINANDNAKCEFMLAKCWQKREAMNMPFISKKSTEDLYYGNSLRNPYFQSLVKNYKQTSVYSQLYNNCSYLRLSNNQ